MKRNIIKLNEIGSTNDYMRKYALANDDEIAVAVANHQTAGRGQGTNRSEERHKGKECRSRWSQYH